MCSRTDETINHIVGECPKLARKEYKRRYDWIGRRIHWEICGVIGIHVKPLWHAHQPEAAIENVKLFGILLHRKTILTTSKRPDMIVIDKDNHE